MREDISPRSRLTPETELVSGAPVEIRETPLGKGVFAIQPFESGDRILRGWGPTTRQRSMHTIQVDWDLHVHPPVPLRFLNHSCEPNCGLLIRNGVADMEVHALRLVDAGEELTLDYESFETEFESLTGPCLCGQAACRGMLGGYKDLPENLREAYGQYIAEYLREADVPLTVAAGV